MPKKRISPSKRQSVFLEIYLDPRNLSRTLGQRSVLMIQRRVDVYLKVNDARNLCFETLLVILAGCPVRMTFPVFPCIADGNQWFPAL